MFIDSRDLGGISKIEQDVCIIGGGAAGITIALELEKHGLGVCLLESGGFSPDEETLDLYRGQNVGLPYQFVDGHRSRFLGGSSNCWGGWCFPFDNWDFEKRAWIPNSGWPFNAQELEPYYERTHKVLKLGPRNFDPAYWERVIGRVDVRRVPLKSGKVRDVVSQFSPPIRFGVDYRRELKASKDIVVYLYANVVTFETDSSARTVKRVKAQTLTGKTVWVQAKLFVLASGGIENARLLLAANEVQSNGLGNGKDLVGRYFMDHPRILTASVRLADAWARNKLYDAKFHYHNTLVSAHGTCVSAQFALTPEVQKDEQLLNSRFWFNSMFPGEGTEAVHALIRCKFRLEGKDCMGHKLSNDLLAILKHPYDPVRFAIARLFHPRSLISDVKLTVIVEPNPDPDSRIMLSDERDALGMPRVRVKWQLDDLVKRTFDRSVQIFADELTSQRIAEVKCDEPFQGRDWPGNLEGTWHHMGTTRMHDSPKQGVVDRNCRVHDMTNLYVAGSSVFPTGGADNPTYTLVALAMRLSDHISRQLQRPEFEVEALDSRVEGAKLVDAA